MARELVRFDILQSRGAEILDVAEQASGIHPYLSSPERRNYATERREDFEALLDSVEPEWRSFLARTPQPV
jgi:hypothetical protein